MARDIRILSGISEWIRNSVGTNAENRGEEESADDDGTDEEDDESTNNSPVCCSAASNSDLTVLDG